MIILIRLKLRASHEWRDLGVFGVPMWHKCRSFLCFRSFSTQSYSQHVFFCIFFSYVKLNKLLSHPSVLILFLNWKFDIYFNFLFFKIPAHIRAKRLMYSYFLVWSPASKPFDENCFSSNWKKKSVENWNSPSLLASVLFLIFSTFF